MLHIIVSDIDCPIVPTSHVCHRSLRRSRDARKYPSQLPVGDPAFEVEWGGFLPASADAIARYLADHAETLSVNTLRARLAALAQWHQTQGFADPTKTPHVRKVLKGIAALHPATEKRARPMQLTQLEKLTAWLGGQIAQAADERSRLACIRNRALVLLGFWRGFRSDELSRLRIEHVTVEVGRGMTLFLPRTKGDRAQLGTTFKAPALSAQHRIESALTTLPPPAPTQPTITEPAKTQLLADEITTSSTPQTHLSLHLAIERNSKFMRGMSKARHWIEDFCHSLYEMRCVNGQRTR